MISQITLITAITKELQKHGVKEMLPRQVNTVINATNMILKEINKPYQPAQDNSGLLTWLQSDDTGISSLYMAYILTNAPQASYAYPLDPSDLHRCLKFLRAVPEAKEKLQLMKNCTQPWPELIEKWNELERLFNQELPSGIAPQTYELMESIFNKYREQSK